MDGSGTINPAALNNPQASNVSQHYLVQSAPRGRKRSRSLEGFDNTISPGEQGHEDDSKPRKRGRLPKAKGLDISNSVAMQPITPATPNSARAPSVRTSHNPLSPSQASPQRTTPTSSGKPPVLKALPTVRDHTTDQLNPERDEYIPRERDDAGEKKVDLDGYLNEREYRLRTFTVPNRGQKLFMLATECARVLGYRDSYLLFNKNRSLFKIIANQEEKDSLITKEVLPYSYRSRQIAIVTARSMFRQFGSRVISDGRRVRDDYWESKARKQGFTEEDAAGEKRPGAAKQREAAAAEAQANAISALPHGQVVYTNPLGGLEDQPQVPPGIHPVTFAPLPMINPLSPDDMHSQSYPQIIRPRQEITGPAYEDQTRESNTSDIAVQAASSAEWNKQLTQQRDIRTNYLENYWKRPHEAPPSPAQSTGEIGGTSLPRSQPHLQSPQQAIMPPISGAPQSMGQPQTSHMMQQGYTPHQQQQHQPPSLLAQSPVRSSYQSLPPGQMQQGSPGLSATPTSARQHTPSYNYSAGGMWPPHQPQPSPHHMQQYGQQHHTPQPQQSPMHPPSQLPRQVNNMGYPQLANPAYGQMNRNMYQQGPQGQQYGQPQQHQQQQQQHSPGMHSGLQGWGQPQPGMGGQDWQRGYQ